MNDGENENLGLFYFKYLSARIFFDLTIPAFKIVGVFITKNMFPNALSKLSTPLYYKKTPQV